MSQKEYFVHSSGIIDEGCVIGENCNLGQNIIISPKVILGKNVRVKNNVSIYEGINCEDDVFLGPSMIFTNVNNPRSAVSRKSEHKPTLVKKAASIGANATLICIIQLVNMHL